ncbi:MAG: hypothetical protein SWJ54_06680 [Cyanobacteriota bacterium]|nr:hypothetical protein [Cyanobacteriota bacterium]
MKTKKYALKIAMNYIKNRGYDPEVMSVEQSCDPDSGNHYLTFTPNNQREKRIDFTVDKRGNVSYWGVRIIPPEVFVPSSNSRSAVLTSTR